MRQRQTPRHAAPKTDARGQLPAPRSIDDTQPLDGKVVDNARKPVTREGLAPAAGPAFPAPSTPFLNTGAPPAPPRATTRGSALPARLTDAERALLGKPVREILGDPDAPTRSLPALRERPRFGASTAHQPKAETTSNGVLILASFYADPEFSGRISQHIKQVSAGALELRRANNARETDLRVRLAALDRAHRAAIAAEAPGQYAQQLAAAASVGPLPQRTPGAALKAIEAGREGETV
jgi:hypothetical protein